MALKEYYLYPGGLFAHAEPHRITTVLGSCVSVCLWDGVRCIGGINHFMLPFWNGEGLASPRYGSIAIPKLVEELLTLGCKKSNLIAKVFGGGDVLGSKSGAMNVGERNVLFAINYLNQERIPIKVSNVGGNHGRKIIFESESGKVLMKKLRRVDGKE